MRKPFTLISVTLLLASCGSNEAESTANDTPQVVGPPTSAPISEPITLDGPRTFQYVTEAGTAGALTIPSDPYQSMEDLYAATNTEGDRTYASVDVDNRQGAEEYGVLEVNLYTPEGEQFTLESVNIAVHELSPFDPNSLAFDLSETIDSETWDDVAIGERRAEYVVTERPLPPDVTRIEVVQSGGGPVQVYPEVNETMTSSETQQEWTGQP